MERREVRQVVLWVLRNHQAESFSAHYHPDIWIEIFRQVFGEEPQDTTDKRFDYLFWMKEGYRALRYVHLYERLAKN
jgi:hypothetical protein